MNPSYAGRMMHHSMMHYPMMNNPFVAVFFVLHLIVGLIVLAGFVFFLYTAWRLMRAHEQIASKLKDVDALTKPKDPEPKQ